MAKNINLLHFVDYLKNKNLKRKTIKEYSYYFQKYVALYPALNMGNINDFLSDPSHQNSPCRAFLKIYILFLKNNRKFYDIDDEKYQDLIEIELPQLSGRKKVRLPRYLTEEQIKKLEATFKKEIEKLSVLISYYCGLRLGELIKIGLNDFNWEKWKTTNYEDYLEVRVFGKGDKEGIALVPPFLGKRVANYINSKKWYVGKDKVFLHSKKLENPETQSRSWQKKLRQAGVEAGISSLDGENKIIQGTQVHPHLLRHSYGASLIEKGVDIRKIQELLRHSSINTTQIYAHLDKKQLKDELREKGFGLEGENAPKSPNTPTEAT